MFASKIITVSIGRPFSDVYDFLADPLNFPKWASNPHSGISALSGGNWLVDLPSGRRAIRFTPRNEFGVLDYQVFDIGETGGAVTPVRLYANGAGADLALTWFQREGVSDERFRSDADWVASDLLRLKALLEHR